MSNPDALERKALELMIVAAHRAYLTALVDWEQASHEADCGECRCRDITPEDYRLLCEELAAETTRRRALFMNLWDDLGFLPKPLLVKIPAGDRACAQRR